MKRLISVFIVLIFLFLIKSINVQCADLCYANISNFSWDTTSNGGSGPWNIEIWANGSACAEEMEFYCEAFAEILVIEWPDNIIGDDGNYAWDWNKAAVDRSLYAEADDPPITSDPGDTQYRCVSKAYAKISYDEDVDEDDNSNWFTF
jgi:hypothetical protein